MLYASQGKARTQVTGFGRKRRPGCGVRMRINAAPGQSAVQDAFSGDPSLQLFSPLVQPKASPQPDNFASSFPLTLGSDLQRGQSLYLRQ